MKREEKNRQALQYAVNRVIFDCKKKKYTKIAISTTLEKNKFVKKAQEKIAEMIQENEIQVIITDSVCCYADSLENVMECDGIILVERYMYTSYKNLDRAMELLRDFEMELLGVINLR